MRELLITPGFANSNSTMEFNEVVELNVLANDRTEVAIRAIMIGFLIDPLVTCTVKSYLNKLT